MSGFRYSQKAGTALSLTHHVAWCPKHRCSGLTPPVDGRPQPLLAEVADERGMTIPAVAPMLEHVRLLVASVPTLCVAEIVKRFEGRTRRVWRQEFPALRSRLPTLWSRSDVAAAVGAVPDATIRPDIAAQKGRSMILSLAYRLFTTAVPDTALIGMHGASCDHDNAGLQQRSEACCRQRISLGDRNQAVELKVVWQADERLVSYSFSVEQRVRRRLDTTFFAVFDRMRRGGKAGFPHSRAKGRFDSVEFRTDDGLAMRQSRTLGIVGIPGEIKARWHRALLAGTGLGAAAISRKAGT